jgi:hypothetical protein
MTILRGIPHPFAGEHVLVTAPPLGPYARATANEPPIKKRLNFFPQRSLTHTALLDEQRSRIAAALSIGQAVAPGVIDGFELGLEGDTLVLMPGHAMGPGGHDIELAYPLRLRFDALPVVSPRVEQELQRRHSGSTPWSRLSSLQRQATLGRVLAELDGADYLPHAMVLVAMPRTVAIDRTGELNSPCPNATDASAFDRTAWEDGFQLAWVPWPEDRTPPLWSQDGSTLDARFRNRLAYAVFNTERERLSLSVPRSMRRWLDEGRMTPAERERLNAEAARQIALAQPWPWEPLGVPLSIVAFDADFRPAFADRAAVVRQGGGRCNRSALVPGAGDDVLWQARVSQLLEHLAELPPEQRNAATLQEQFDWLPPAGVLPLDVADFVNRRQQLFPPQFDVQAQPVPLDMVDALIAEASPMRPFNLSLRDQVQLLVPVPARYFDPDLLKLDERVHPLFDLEISRLEGERLRLLSRRDGLRRRSDWLMQAVTGSLPSYPQDDPNALPDEAGALDALAFARVHRSSVSANGADLHQFSGAHARLRFEAVDELFVFVRFTGSPAGIGIRPLVSAESDSTPPTTRPFVWGAAPNNANGDRVGDLPPANTWFKLAVPMARAGLAGEAIDGLAFAVFGGNQACEVTWGYAGKSANGMESYWLTDALPPGARAEGTWAWLTQGEAFSTAEDLSAGLPIEAVSTRTDARPHTRHVTELDKLREAWANFRNGVLNVELGEPASGTRTASTPPRTIDAGIDELITRLDGRIRTASDHVDFGFLRARTEIFRMRQSVLGVDNAGRFLTSPAAAELVTRSENPVATEKEFADYFKRLNEAPPAPPPFTTAPRPAPAPANGSSPPPPPPPPPAPAPAPTGGVLLNLSALNAGLLTTRSTTVLRADLLGGVAAPVQPSVSTTAGVLGGQAGGDLLSRGVALDTGGLRAPTGIVAPRINIGAATLRPASLAVEPPAAVKDVVSASLLGATYNTVTVAERFSLPASVVSSNSAAKGKSDFVTSGLTALQARGVVIDDLPVYGYRRTDVEGENDDPTQVSAADLLTRSANVRDDDGVALSADQHEAVYFRRGIEAIDNTVRFLRGMELRAEDYRRLQADAKNARTNILAVVARLQTAIDALAGRLAEVRHDLSVARALRAEEQARVDALVARRKAILAEQVPYLVFRRPRLGDVLQDVPLLAAQPAEVEDPVPRCRGEAHEAPAELLAMVDTLRDVPVRWWRRLARDFAKLDRLSDLRQLAEASAGRVTQAYDKKAHVLREAAKAGDSPTGQLLQRSLKRQVERVEKSYQRAAPQVRAVAAAATWKQAVQPMQMLASIRDVLVIAPASREFTLAASGLLDDVAGVAACLHAAFCTVPPATRLRWAELFSQLDEATSMRLLSVLPGFGDERLGVDHIVWRQMQRMVDWLFMQVADEDDAVDAINDLVRVCLLLASHAPVKRIVSARIRQPRPAVVDTTLELELDPQTTRVGMQVLVHGAAVAGAAPTVIARAVVEDLGAVGAVARITQVMTAQPVMLTASMQVQVQSGPALSTPKEQKKDAEVVKAVIAAAAAAVPAAKGVSKGVSPQPTDTAEKRVAKQVEVLRAGSGPRGMGRR